MDQNANSALRLLMEECIEREGFELIQWREVPTENE